MRKFFQVVFLLAALLPLALSTPGAAQNSLIEDNERKIEQRRQQIEERRQALEEQQRQALFTIKELDVTNATLEEVDAALQQVNGWIDAAESRLASVKLAQAAAQERVTTAEERAADLDEDIAAIRQQMQRQVVEFYLDMVYEENFLLKDGDPNRNARRQYYIEELGGDAQVLIDWLRRAQDDQQSAMEQAEQAEVEIEQAKAEVEATLAELDELKAEQEDLQAEWNQRKAELEAQVAAEEQASLDIENEIASANQEIQNLEAEIAREQDRLRKERLERERQARLAELERQRQARIAELQAKESRGQFDNPAFFQPVPGTVGSGFGNRIHPIFGVPRFHAGVDFAGNTGDPIQAAASGKVIQVKNREGYGNTVMIDHGDGWTTLYAHLSSYAVGLGTQVALGQVIGAVGSTGWSTGPHLHFEIRYEGVPQDPAKYL